MKTFLSRLLLVTTIGLGASCVPDDYKSTFGYKPFVQISTNAVKVSEDTDPAQATVQFQYVGAALSQDLTINLTSTIDGPADGITQPPATVVIKAGEFMGSAVVSFTNNVVNDGNKVVTIQITSTSSDAVLVATPQTSRDKGTVTIVDDDCPFDINDFVGSYKLDMVLANDFVFPPDDYPDNDVTLTLGDDPNTLVDPDFMLLNTFTEGDFDAVPVTIQLDPETLATSIVGDPFNFLDGTSTGNAVVAYNDAPNRRVFTNGDNPGSFAVCSKTIVVHGIIRREDGSLAQDYTLTYVKQ